MTWRGGVVLKRFVFVTCWVVVATQSISSYSSFWNYSSTYSSVDPALYPNCSGIFSWINDSICDERNNNPACGYDGGDCCVCTASHQFLPARVTCLDPSAGQALYDCREPPPITASCANDTVEEWIVEDTASATALAEAVDCSGGAFQVKWRGIVAIDRTIYVGAGTILNITGLDSMACIDGNDTHRLFTVVNASLNIDNLKLSRGNAAAGGAIAASTSRVALHNTSFISNVAYSEGGALFIIDTSTVSGGGETVFFQNRAYSNGGAVHIDGGSSIFWAGDMSFSSNNRGTVTFRQNDCGGYGGGLNVDGRSIASWNTAAVFENNTANGFLDSRGGALSVDLGSTVFWQAETSFVENLASDVGGALYVGNGSTISAEADAIFDSNVGFLGGGAVFVGYNCSLVWYGQTNFSNNFADTHGGALGSSLSITGQSPSYLTMNGGTSFLNNWAGENGGGMAITGSLKFNSSETAYITFSGNTADIAGGALFITEAGMGPHFVNVSFIGNSAKLGGGVYVTQSGTTDTKTIAGETVSHPTVFLGCTFVDNVAETTGGAVESDAGRTGFNASLFKGNRARSGGALSLAGRANFDECSFVENISEEDGGAAVSNTAVLSTIVGNKFVDNGFLCKVHKILDFEDADLDAVITTVCNGCGTECPGCVFDGGVPLCIDQIDNSYSSGGNVTLETLTILPGYWRATNTSPNVLACFNAAACRGGITGTPGYCDTGYEGPYCSICTDGYVGGPGFKCTACANNTGGLVLFITVAILAVVVLAAFVPYLIFGEKEGARLGILSRVQRCMPLQTIKIVIVVWQILTQFVSVANVTYPGVYQTFLESVDLVNFDWSWILSTGCIWNVSFHDNLLLSTLCPLIGIAILGGTYAIAARRNRSSEAGLGRVRQRHLSMVLLLTFLVYSSVSSKLFQAFACETLDDDKNYLRADYRIECDSSEHIAHQIYAGFMMILYTAGIPLLYAVLLFRHRNVLTNPEGREEDLVLKSTTDLWKPYKPDRSYYEVIECGRRILLTGVVVFIYPNTPSQIAVILVVAVFYMVVAESLAPYASRLDVWVSRAGHVIVFLSMYVALLLKVDLSNERAGSEGVFEVILVCAHACMICAVLVEATVMIFLLRADNKETSMPRVRGGGVVSFVYPVELSERGDDDGASCFDVAYMEKQRDAEDV